MNDRTNITIDEVTNAIYESLSNNIRRKIIILLANEGPLAFRDLMRKCNIRDSGTLNYHLERMKLLVVKDEQGLYRLSKIGRIAYENIVELKSRIELILPHIKGSTPIILLKPSRRPLIVYSAIACSIIAIILQLLSSYTQTPIAIGIIIIVLAILMYGLTNIMKQRLSSYIIKHNTIIEKSNLIIANRERIINGRIIDVSISKNILTNLFNCVNITLTLKNNGEVIIVKIPYIPKSSCMISDLMARKYD